MKNWLKDTKFTVRIENYSVDFKILEDKGSWVVLYYNYNDPVPSPFGMSIRPDGRTTYRKSEMDSFVNNGKWKMLSYEELEYLPKELFEI